MIVPDVNLLVYAHNPDSLLHDVARRWWDDLLDGVENVGVPWAVATGFVRVINVPGVLNHPISPATAADFVADWFRHPHVAPLNPGDGHLVLFQQNLVVPGSNANLVPDAHIAALAMERDAELHSSDSDFIRFPGLRWRNPLL